MRIMLICISKVLVDTLYHRFKWKSDTIVKDSVEVDDVR